MRRPDLAPDALRPAAPDRPVEPERPITATRLIAPSQWQAGALPDGDPLARRPWGDLPATTVRRLVDALPAPSPASAPAGLERRVLLAPGPAGADAALFQARVDGLLARGGATGALELLRGLPPAAMAERRRAVFEAALLAGRVEEACASVQGLGESDTYTAAARLTCALLMSEEARAQVLASVLRERRVAYLGEIEPFIAAALKGDGPALARTGAPLAAMAAALLAVRPLDRAAGLPDNAAPTIAAQLARNRTLDPALRLAVADRAFRAATIGPEPVREALAAVPGDPRAQRLASIRGAEVPAVRAERLAQAWRLDLPPAERLLWARVLETDARALDPSLETLPAAEATVPILLLAGDVDAVRRWDQILRFPGAARTDLPGLRARLAPLLATAGLGEPLDPGAQTPRERAILDALGRLGGQADPLLRALDAPLATPGAAAPLARLQGLAEAERHGAPAAVAVLALLVLGDAPETTTEIVVDAALRALRGAGLGAEARQLGVALMIAALPAGRA